jgi:cell division protein FtsN
VVYLAYTEGVQKGRADLPRVIAAQPGPAKVAPTDGGSSVTPYKGLKIYEQPAPTDEDAADQDSAPQPPTEVKPMAPAPMAPSTALATPPATAPAKPLTIAPPATATQTATKPAVAAPSVAKPTQTQVATTAPHSLTPPATTTTKPAAVETKPLATAPAPAATTPPAAAAAPTGSYLVQVASYPSEAEAQMAFSELKRKNGALLSGYAANVKRVDLGPKGVWYRLRVGPVADKEAAAALASRIGGGSFPTKP